MAIEQTVVKTLVLTGPITLYEVSAVCESLRVALCPKGSRYGSI